MTPRRTGLVLAIAAMLALTGCGATPQSEPTTAPPAAPSPPATIAAPTPSPEPAHTVAFGGECTNMMSEAQIASILGPGTVSFADWAATHALEWRTAGAERTAGGIECRWMAAEGASGLPPGMQDIAVLALPVAAVADRFVDELTEARCDPQYDATNCRLGRVVGPIWLMARSGPGLEEPPHEELEAALDAVATNLPAFDEPVPMTRGTAWWPVGTCEELGEQMELSELLGPAYHTGRWEGSPQYEDWILEAAGVRQFCQWSSDSSQIPDGHDHYIISATLEPGGVWQWEEIVPQDGDTVSVEGARQAVRTVTGSAGWHNRTVWANDGINVVTVTAEGGDVDVDVAERVLGARAGG